MGTSLYSYNPAGPMPRLGANRLARVDGPLPNAAVTYDYDELGTVKSVGVNGDARTLERDLAGRITSETNALGEFTYTYGGASNRLETESYPNGQSVEYGYGTVEQDFDLRRITNEVNGNLLSEFTYDRDVAAGRITTWTQAASPQPTLAYTFGYDDVNQLTSSTLPGNGQPTQLTTYAYDAAGNRVLVETDETEAAYSHNALNQLTGIADSAASPINYQWDAQDRLVQIENGTTIVRLGYDGMSRLVSVTVSTDGATASDTRYVWSGDDIVAETDAMGTTTKRFFDRGMQIDQGATAGIYCYSRDHLGSLREVVDEVGAVRARYGYLLFGERTKVTGDSEAHLGFAGLVHQRETGVAFARFRAYDAVSGRWLSRDPLGELMGDPEDDTLWSIDGGANLYAYVGNDPVNHIDPEGLQSRPGAEVTVPIGPDFRRRGTPKVDPKDLPGPPSFPRPRPMPRQPPNPSDKPPPRLPTVPRPPGLPKFVPWFPEPPRPDYRAPIPWPWPAPTVCNFR